MRRRTALGLGSLTAATALLLGLGGTTALLSDTASESAVAGAGSLRLSRTDSDTGVELQAGSTATIPLQAQLSGGAPAVLKVSAVGESGAAPCPAGVTISVDVPHEERQEPTDLCGLLPSTGPMQANVLLLEADAAPIDLPLTVLLMAEGTSPAADWEGVLSFTLQHPDGGFSDQADVALRVSPPVPVPVEESPNVTARTSDELTDESGDSPGQTAVTGDVDGGAGEDVDSDPEAEQLPTDAPGNTAADATVADGSPTGTTAD
ncbi:hypothetical protein [Geodermatophilus sp. CPCC 206100]|uniref:hypothetical protein n=1 Tax=Geodermatophilus sp. CPCC 206100 TaxID=3020054 RepID=UPI003B00FAE9